MGGSVNVAVEGLLDEAVLKRMLASIDVPVESVYGRRGKTYIRENLPRYNEAAQYGRWVVLVDLNDDAQCPPPLVASWLPRRNQNLHLRVAVRAIEAWLLADREAMADFLHVPQAKIPQQPEAESNPKATLINIARHSRSRGIREDIVPREESTASQGVGYNSRLTEFVMKYWDPERAASRAESLRRSLASLLRWKNE